MSPYRVRDYKIFLNTRYIQTLVNRHIKRIFPGFIKCTQVTSKHYKVLAATSFLVRYEITLETKTGYQHHLEVRGNRLNRRSYKILQRLWQTHKFKKYYYPRPIYYFPKKQFVLYENFSGQVYRSWPDKNFNFYNKTLPLIALRLADLHTTKIASDKIITLNEKIHWIDDKLRKIKRHNFAYYEVSQQAAEKIKKFLKLHYAKSHLSLCHNDFQASNIIYNPHGPEIGIIDFELLGFFFPAADLANFNIQLLTVIKDSLPPKKIIHLQKKFIRSYKNNVGRQRTRQLENALPYFEAKSILDILALYTVQILGETEKTHVRYLKKAMAQLYGRLKNLNLTLT